MPLGTFLFPNTWGPPESEESEAPTGAQIGEIKESWETINGTHLIIFVLRDVSYNRAGRIRVGMPGNTGELVLRVAWGDSFNTLLEATLCPTTSEMEGTGELARICRESFSMI